MKRNVVPVAAIVILIILLGQYVSYYSDRGTCTISSETDGTTISFSVDTDFDTQITETSLSNGHDIPRSFLILYDESVGSCIEYNHLKSTVYLLSNYLRGCDGIHFKTGSVEEFTDIVENDLTSGSYDTGLIIINGALPYTVYDGTAASKMVQWVENGGTLYWSGPPIGKYIAEKGGVTESEDFASVSTELFGITDAFNDDADDAYGYERIGEDISDSIGVMFNKVQYGLDIATVSNSVFLGYTDGRYASIGVVGCGLGEIGVFGGWVIYEHIYDLVNLIAAGVTHESILTNSHVGSITDGHYNGQIEDSASLTHIIRLHDIKTSRIWIYDRTEERFI